MCGVAAQRLVGYAKNANHPTFLCPSPGGRGVINAPLESGQPFGTGAIRLRTSCSINTTTINATPETSA